MLGVIPWASSIYDKSHEITVRCEVLSAEVSSSSSRSLRGVGSSSTLVAIETENCGRLLQSEGVYRENASIIVDELKQGTYDFEVGESGWALRGFYGLLGVSPSASSFERVR